MSRIQSIALLGFGEVGQTLLPSLGDAGVILWAFDRQFADPGSEPSGAAAKAPQLHLADSAAQAAANVQLVISAVTAEQCLAAAAECASGLQPGSWFVDLNSASPATKREAATLVEQAGARYIDAAVMAPIAPAGIATPILLGGPSADEFHGLARSLGFSEARVFAREVGKAAACKMCRSVLIKGLESLLLEALLAARSYGVQDTVIESLNNLMPGVDWREHGAYMIGRSLEHGTRRAEEMNEAARTVEEAGIEPRMSRASAATQLWGGRFRSALAQVELEERLDEILEGCKPC
ncbi:DUF1932 domain-containing protein [Gilvimarinus sp. F26214L]|uniref:DUF1932 domain-containing protein n=1 Tax=Gilvimarinus sp. DZF01 TaxID=3461371 RepID=UPI00404544D3